MEEVSLSDRSVPVTLHSFHSSFLFTSWCVYLSNQWKNTEASFVRPAGGAVTQMEDQAVNEAPFFRFHISNFWDIIFFPRLETVGHYRLEETIIYVLIDYLLTSFPIQIVKRTNITISDKMNLLCWSEGWSFWKLFQFFRMTWCFERGGVWCFYGVKHFELPCYCCRNKLHLTRDSGDAAIELHSSFSAISVSFPEWLLSLRMLPAQWVGWHVWLLNVASPVLLIFDSKSGDNTDGGGCTWGCSKGDSLLQPHAAAC